MERAIARGKRLAHVNLGCAECHGADGSGTLVADAMPVWIWWAPNITSGGLTKDYTAADFDRIIRHGVKKNGQNGTMPAEDYKNLSDREVSDLAAWVRSLPPSDVVRPELQVGPMGNILIGMGVLPIAAEMIDHDMTHKELPPEPAVTKEFGNHLANTCIGCHREHWEGGKIAQGPPDWPPAPNLTPHEEGDLKGWTEQDFINLMRTGKRPDGSEVHTAMPWEMLSQSTDVELKAMWLHFQSIEPRPTGK